MPQEPIFEKTIGMPLGYVFTARARPSTVRRTVIRLLPWAMYAMLPPGRRARMALSFARRFSPLVRQKGV
ncbi:MAG: hypothetical protein EPO22_13470 [Dehalococcoidia bacterium]|nr:MAG: hypothetical protein EPO22_13470 [Dehalococcoidia bacterium]